MPSSEDIEALLDAKKKMIKSMMDASAKVLTKDGAITPKDYTQIPKLFEGWDGTASKAVRGALWIAKENELIPPNTPLRQVWYMFVKLIYQKLKKKLLNPEDSYTKSFADIMKATDLWYRDFNVVNPPSSYKPVDGFWKAELFPNIMLALEKESYYATLDNFADLIGANLYASGGQSSFTNAEDISRSLNKAHPDKDVNIYTVSDYDPAGFNIGNALKEHFSYYLERTGQKVNSTKVSPFPKDYDKDTELQDAKFIVSPETVKQQRWNTPERIKEREDVDLIDHRFENIDFYDESKGSEIRDVLSEGFLKPKQHIAWIQDWREKVKNGQIPHMLGLEVESLPQIPLDEQMPDGMDASDAVGNARMRLFIYDKLLEEFKIEDALGSFYRKYYFEEYPTEQAWKIFKKKADIHELEAIKDKIDKRLDKIIETQSDVLGDDYDKLKEHLDEWIDNVDPDGEIVKKFEHTLREAIALNLDQGNFAKEKANYKEINKEIYDFDLTQDTKDVLKGVSEHNFGFFNDVLQNIKDELGDDDIEDDEE